MTGLLAVDLASTTLGDRDLVELWGLPDGFEVRFPYASDMAKGRPRRQLGMAEVARFDSTYGTHFTQVVGKGDYRGIDLAGLMHMLHSMEREQAEGLRRSDDAYVRTLREEIERRKAQGEVPWAYSGL